MSKRDQPFRCVSIIQTSLHTPLSADICALVQLYCQILARKNALDGVEANLPVPEFRGFVKVVHVLLFSRLLDAMGLHHGCSELRW